MLLKSLFNWVIGLFRLKKTIGCNEEYKLVVVSELPEYPRDKVLYIEGNQTSKDYWYALLKCPCGCDDNIMLNLIDDTHPCWKVIIDNKNFSISPSIWKTEKCKSHFWLSNKKINWV